jgi:hypothetical protein
MRSLLRLLVLTAALGALAAPAAASTIVTLALDPGQSSLTPQVGAGQSLGGTITLRLGALPLGGSNTTFDVIGLAVTASGGATIGLDPAVVNPGLGVLTPAGVFVVPTLFVRITQGTPVDLPIPDVTGSVLFGPGGASIERLETTFGIDTGAPAGVVTVHVVAVPEPASAVLLAFGIAALASRRARPEALR